MPLSGPKRGPVDQILRALNGVSGGRTYDAVIATCTEKGNASKLESVICHLEIPSFARTDFTVVIPGSFWPPPFSGFLVSKEGQQKIADLDNVVVRKDVEPKIALDRSKLRVIDPAEGNRIDYYMGLINDLFVKAN
ncbi:MAG TPA: hypothetical protein VEQ38_21875 [Verrucomicrobiae bacterium]|nr:hypothetical protein [Verrucomicrobiae bacterium]